MKPSLLCALVGITVSLVATEAHAAIHRVSPGESIQAAIDAAKNGDEILLAACMVG